MYKLQEIKEEIYTNVVNAFLSGSPIFSEDQVRKGINLFIDFLNTKATHKKLYGLSVAIFNSLQVLLLEHKFTNRNELEILATKVEPFCRKVLMLKEGKNYDELANVNLAPLFKRLHLNNALSMQNRITDFPVLKEENLDGFKHEPEYLYSIAIVYVKRNDIHNASLLDPADMHMLLKHVLIVYIYVILKNEQVVANEVANNGGNNYVNEEENIKQKLLFDFFNYGDTSTELKKQIVNAYIENYLYLHPCSSISGLVTESSNFFKNAFGKDFFSTTS